MRHRTKEVRCTPPPPEREQLVADIKHAGFYPDLVLEVVDDALAGLNPDAHFVQHETHFSRDDFHRHITVMVLCGEHVIFAHLDDQHLEGDAQGTVAHVSVEAVHLSALNAVTISYGFSQPQAYNAGSTAPTEISFQIAWTGSLHMELAPAGCQDPQCNADHASPAMRAARTLRCVFLRPLTARSRFSVRSILRVLCTVPACTQPADKHHR